MHKTQGSAFVQKVLALAAGSAEAGVVPPAQAAPAAAAPAPNAENAPPSRTATWTQVSSVADDDVAKQDSAKQQLDIAWIDKLPDHLRNTIDTNFADDAAAAKVARETKNDPGLRTLDKEINEQEAALKNSVVQRLKQDHPKVTDAIVKADPEYVKGMSDLEQQRRQQAQARTTEIGQADDTAVAENPGGAREQSVAAPPTATIKRGEGKALARTNFMSWAVDVMGSPDAVKAHFMGISPVSGQPGMWLSREAKARFEAARTNFEQEHPGFTFPDTDVAQSMRGLHEKREGLGMLGHALGVAFDFLAVDNPNLKIEKPTKSNYGYMLNRFGAPNPEQRGRSTMNLTPGKSDPGYGHSADATIEQLGKDTMAGKSTPEGEAMAHRAVEQFDQMVATSRQFQASMAGNLDELHGARDLYFNLGIDKQELAKLEAAKAHPDAFVAAQLRSEKFTGDKTAKAQRASEIKAQLATDVDTLEKQVQTNEEKLRTAMAHAFKQWNDVIEKDVGHDDAGLASNAASTAAMTADQKALAAVDTKAPDAMDRLTTFASGHELSTPDQLKRPPKDAAAYKKLLGDELAKKQRGEQTRIASSRLVNNSGNDYYNTDKAELEAWEARLADPAIVFGKGTQQKDGHWTSNYNVENVPVMQMIENGFVHDDEMAAPSAKADPNASADPAAKAGPSPTKGKLEHVFNDAVVETLVRFGWSPGATYGDTMHFDFIEGYSLAAPGGRSAKNMQATRYSPEGDLPEKKTK